MIDDNGFRRVEYVSTHDGDTFVGRIVLLKVRADVNYAERHIRVHGWNAAELSEAEGPAMRDLFEKALEQARMITIYPVARSFERIVCDVYIDGEQFSGVLRKALRVARLSNAEHPQHP